MKEGVELQFLGDVSLNGLFCDPQYHEHLSASLNLLGQELGHCDYRVVNWEAPITKEGKFNHLKNPVICTTLEAATHFVQSYKVNAVCLGNNHIGDCLEEGYLLSRKFFDQNNIQTFGSSSVGDEEQVASLMLNLNGVRIGMLSYVGRETNPKILPESRIKIEFIEEASILNEISNWKGKVDHLIVHLHWGIEYNHYPSMEQRILAKSFIDAGASVIVGHHSHTLQGIEEYNEGLIVYSLGNFIFSGLKGKESFGWPSFCRNSVAIKVILNKDGVVNYSTQDFVSTNTGVELGSHGLLKKLSRPLTYSLKLYKIVRMMNVLSIWGFRLPLFLIKTKGGIFKALRAYFNIKYLRLFLSYFRPLK